MVETEFPVEDKFDHLADPTPAATRARGITAFVTVQEGCDKFCTFCVVPYTRGAEVSRPAAKIIAEVERLTDAGVREITLIGQNVNAYHGEGPDGRAWTLGALLARVADIPGVERLRYTTSHPRDVDDSLIAAHRDIAALMPQLHLPVQSGSDRILAAMNRRHTRADYLRVIDRLRTARADMAFTSDFIVGFPGESEQDFRDTLRIVDDVSYAAAFSFKYSPRPGTPAADRADQVAEPDKIAAPGTPAGADRAPSPFLQRAVPRKSLPRLVRAAWTPSWTIGRPLALSATGAGDGARVPHRQNCGA